MRERNEVVWRCQSCEFDIIGVAAASQCSLMALNSILVRRRTQTIFIFQTKSVIHCRWLNARESPAYLPRNECPFWCIRASVFRLITEHFCAKLNGIPFGVFTIFIEMHLFDRAFGARLRRASLFASSEQRFAENGKTGRRFPQIQINEIEINVSAEDFCLCCALAVEQKERDEI